MRLLVLPIAAVALWAWSLRGIDPLAMNDLGVISLLTWQAWLAYALITVSFVACWRHAERATWPLILHVLVLLVMLYGLPAFITHEPSGPIVFRHAGITETLLRTGNVHAKLDAYFSWPGFFMGLGTLVKLAGAPSAMAFAKWATVGFNLLYLPPLLLLARALTRDPRLIWGTVWVFYAANWIDQDYLAPQAFTYLFYLTILALLLTYLRPRGSQLEGSGRLARRLQAVLHVRAADDPSPPTSRFTAAAVVVVVILLYTATVASHQLTPFTILIDVIALVALGHCTARGLPLLMAVILTLWVAFVAHGYIAGHFSQLVSVVGDVAKATSTNVTSRISGSSQHILVVRERLLLSGALWLLAIVGAFRRFRRGHADHAAAALGLAPLLLFGIQPYGGEMLMRIYFFMLPFVAFFATAAFLSDRVGTSAPARLPAALRTGAATAAFGLTAATVLGGCLLARYGNERVDYFTPRERAAIRFLYAQAQPGSRFAVEEPYLPWKYKDYDQHRYLSVEQLLRQPSAPSAAQALNRLSQDLRPGLGRPPGFVILTRSQHVYVEMLGGVMSPGYLHQFERYLRESPKFRLIYSNADAQIYERLPR